MGKTKDQQHGIKRYKTIVHEKNIAEVKERMIMGYLIFSVILTIIKFFIPRDNKANAYAYERSQVFFLLPVVYFYIISAIVDSNPDKLKYSLIITSIFFIKIIRRFIVESSVTLFTVYFSLLVAFFIYHWHVINKLSVLYPSEIKKRLSLLNERYNVALDVEALHKAYIRLTLLALSEQLFYINIDQVVALIIYNDGFYMGATLELFLVSLRFLSLYISKIAESLSLRIISIVLYVLVPIYYIIKFKTEASGQRQNFIISKVSFAVSIALLAVEITLSIIIALLAYLDLDNFGKGLTKL